jgi:hypothetical protein
MALDTVSRIHVAQLRERDHHVIPQAERHAPVIKLDSGVEGQGMNVARLHGEVGRLPVHTLCVLVGVGIEVDHRLACDGASESGVAAAVGSGLGRAHMLPILHLAPRLSSLEFKKF